MVATKAIRQGLYQKLNVSSVTTLLASGSASLHHAVAPASASWPLVVFQKQAGTPVARMGGQAMKNDLWLVKAIDRNTSSSRAEDIDAAINTVLDYQTLAVAGGENLFLARQSDVDYLETVGDQVFRHHGALYRVTTA